MRQLPAGLLELVKLINDPRPPPGASAKVQGIRLLFDRFAPDEPPKRPELPRSEEQVQQDRATSPSPLSASFVRWGDRRLGALRLLRRDQRAVGGVGRVGADDVPVRPLACVEIRVVKVQHVRTID